MPRQRWLLPMLLVLVALLGVGPAEGGGISKRSAATQSALAALGVGGRSSAEIVFGPVGPLPAGTVIGEGGPGTPGSGGLAVSRPGRVVATVRRASWFFYDDLAPFQQYEHPGRVALVDVRTGRVTVSRMLSWPPVIGGRLPVFLRSQGAYDGSGDRAFYRPYKGAAALTAGDRGPSAARVAREETGPLDSPGANELAGLLASEHACTIRATDTVPGGYYAFANVSPSRAALALRFSKLASLAPGFQSFIYPGGGSSIAAFIGHQIAAHGCKDMLVYLAGGGYRHGTAVNVGMGVGARRLVAQDVTLGDLTSLIRSHPGVTFELALDAAHASAFQALNRLSNVLLVATPAAPGGGSFTYVPEALVGGRLVANGTNPLHLLQFTDRLLFGLTSVIDDPAQVAKAVALAQAGKLRSVLAYLISRGFADGGGVDFTTGTGVGSPPVVQTGGTTVTGGNLPPTAVDDTASTDKHTAIDIPVLANDSDADGDTVTVASVDTAQTKGLVAINPDGTIHYDPNGQFQNLNAGQSATDRFSYQASDGSQDSAPATVTVTITGANDPPVLSGVESSTLAYEAGNPGAALTSTLAVSDPDDTELAGATVKISSGLATGEDSLGFTNQNGITGSYDSSAGVLTLSGAASLAAYQAALRSVAYADSNAVSPSTAPRTVSFQVDDGHSLNNLSNVVTRQVSVTPNAAPTVVPDAASTAKHTAIEIPVLANDGDPDGDTVHVDPASINTTGTKGLVTLNSNGTIHYDPSGQFDTLQQGQTATDTFSYKVSDGYQDSPPATVTITITGLNDPPVLSNIESTALSYNAGTAAAVVTSTLIAGDDDDTNLTSATATISSGLVAGEDSLSFTPQGGIAGSYDPSTGVLTMSGSSSVASYQSALRSVTYADSNGSNAASGARTISFQLNDGHAANNLSSVVTRNVTVSGNPVPTAGNDTASTGKHTALDIPVLANDSDTDGDTLSVDPASINTTGTLGLVTVNSNGTIHYDPNGHFETLQAGQAATDTFSYKVSDGYHDSSAATVTVTINGLNDPPVLSNIESSALPYDAGTTAVPVTSSSTVSDPDDTSLSGATAAISSGLVAAEDALTFTPVGGITGSYDSTTGVLTMSGGSSLANYQTALRSVTYSDSNGTTPTTGTRTISLQVNDGHTSGNLSNVATRNITVSPNPVPVTVNDSASTDKNTAIAIPVLANDGDSDGDALHIASVGTSGTQGSVSVNSDGTIHYDPNGRFTTLQAGLSATDTFTYKISDGYHDSTAATVTVTINGLNDPPVLSNIESSALPYDAGTAPVAVTSSSTVNDDDDTTLSGATATISSGLVAAEDALTFTPVGGIAGSYSPSTGVLTMSGSSSLANYQTALRSVTYSDSNGTTPTTGTRTISFQANDGQPANNLSAVVARDITVSPNPAPTTAADTASTDKHTAIDIPVLANDSDSDGDTLSVDPASINTTGTLGLVTLNSNGTIHYDPNGQFATLQQGQTATDTFTYKTSDGFHDSSAATVTVTINGLNDPPVLSNIESTALPYNAGTTAAAVTSSLTVGDPDDTNLAGATVNISSGLVPGEDSLAFTAQAGIAGSYNSTTGVLAFSGSASLATYQTLLRSVTYGDSNGTNPNTGTRTIGFQVDDGGASNNLSSVVSRNVTVNPNPVPTANSDSASTGKHTAIDVPVLANDSDSDGDTLSVDPASINTTGTLGTVSLNPDGTIHYDPNGQFATLQQGQTATDTFTYKTSDGFHDSSAATVTVTINGLNDPPVLTSIESGTLQYTAGTASVAATATLAVSDPDDTNLSGATVTISSGLVSAEDSLLFASQNGITGGYNSTTGVLTLSGTSSIANYQAALRSVTYADSNGTNPTTGTRAISFQVDDGHTASNLSNVASRTLNVNPNPVPTAVDDTTSTDKNTAIDIPVLSNDSDSDGDTLHVSSVDTSTSHTVGVVSINSNGTVHYDPSGGFPNLLQGQTATDTFTYKASDGFHDSSSATVTVTVNGVNDPPVLGNLESSALGYRSQDPATAITSTLTVSDADTTNLASATVSIGTGFSSTADLLQFTNGNGITGSYNSTSGVMSLTGSSSLANYQTALRSVRFSSTDSAASPAARTISFAAADSQGTTSTPVTRQITVGEANQAPIAATDSYSAVGNTTLAVGTTVSGPAVTVSGGSVLNNDSDPDSTSPLTVTNNTQSAHGTVTMNSNGTFTYVPTTGFTGADSFTYTVSDSDDSANPKTATGTVNITVASLVWYVNNSLAPAGSGTSSSPFNTLAAANSAAGSGSIVFLYSGSGNYTGGTTMQSSEQLIGQPNGLTVSGHALVSPSGTTPVITNSGGAGVALASGADVEGVNVANTSGNGLAASSVGAATVGSSTPVNISSSGGDGIHVSGGSGTLNLVGANVNGSTGHSVSIASRTGGTTTLGGTISDTGTGISLSSNTGATINFTGAITASTGANRAFSAIGGGTIAATGAGSLLATTTGTALNVTSTTIGGSGLNFQSISANGAPNGIALSSTGSSGGLTVTGTGSAGSGGTIQGATGAGVLLSSTSSPSLTDMVIKNGSADGINGSSVNGLTLAGTSVSGNGSTSGQDGLNFSNGLTGTVSITNSSITNSGDSNGQITDSSGSLNLTVTGSTFSGTGNPSTGTSTDYGLRIIENGSTSATVSITGSTFANSNNDHFDFATTTGDTGTNSVTFSNNTLSEAGSYSSNNLGVGAGVTIAESGASNTAITVDNNTITGAKSNGINLVDSGTTGYHGTVSGNTVGSPSVACSGSAGGNDIQASADGSTTATLAITNNHLYQYGNAAGLEVLDHVGSATMNMTITGNTIADPVDPIVTPTCPSGVHSGALFGLLLVSGAQTSDTGLVCAAVSSNSMTGSSPSAADGGIDDFELDQDGSATYKLPGYTGGATDSNAVVSFIQANNNIGGTPSGDTFVQGTGNMFNGSTTSCPTPP